MRAVRNLVLGVIVVACFSFSIPMENDVKKQVRLKVIAHTFEDLNSNITVDLIKNGSVLQKDLKNSKNKFNLMLDLNETYEVRVEQPGCQSKVLSIDTGVDGMAKGNLSYVIEVYMKKEIIGSLEADKIKFHLFHGTNDKTLLMLADG